MTWASRKGMIAVSGLAAVLVLSLVMGRDDEVVPRAANLTVTGAAAGPRGTPVSLQFGQVPAVTVR